MTIQKKRQKDLRYCFHATIPKPLPCPETRLQMKHGQELLAYFETAWHLSQEKFTQNSRRYPVSLTYRLPMG